MKRKPSPSLTVRMSNSRPDNILRHAGKFIFFVALFINVITAANGQIRIFGRVTGSDEKPLSQATVLLLKPKDSSLFKGTITNDNGAYFFENIAEGEYLLSYSFTGYVQVYSTVFKVPAGTGSSDKGTTVLNVNKVLDNVTVAARKPLYEQKIDRLMINVAASITSAGLTVLDVLERSPGVLVDRVSNSLSINGKSGIIVMINNKRNYLDMAGLIQMLASMPSGSIERIEIITTPPANFDAEGNAGIINIILKSNGQFGTNGSFTLSGGYQKGENNAASLNINHRKGKINLFGNYDASRYHSQQLWTNYHAVKTGQDFNEDYSADTRDFVAFQNSAQAGIDYDASKKTIIGGIISVFYRHWKMKSLNDAVVSQNMLPDTSIKTTNNELHTTFNYNINFNIQHTFKPDEKLTLNTDYLYYRDNNPNTYLNTYYDNSGSLVYNENVQSAKLTPLRFWIFALDYTKKLSKKADLEAGLKSTSSGFRDDVGVNYLIQSQWVKDSTLSGSHKLNESINAAYGSLSLKLTEKTSMKMGLRYEYTHAELEIAETKNTINRNYGNLFPSFFILHTINEKTSINFSYSKRIWRPGFYDLAPWVIFYDPKTFSTGNSSLQPSVTDAVNAAYTYKNKIVTLSYSYSSRPIIYESTVDTSNNRLVFAAQNGVNSIAYTVSLSLPFTVTKWWTMQNNLTAGLYTGDFVYKESVHTKVRNLYFNSTQTFALPKDFSFEITSFYRTKGSFGLGVFQPWGTIGAGVQKKWIKKKTSLSLNVFNIMHKPFKGITDVPGQNLLVKRANYVYTGYSLSFTHNFGNDKVKGKRNRSTGDEDEKNRAY